MAYADTTDDIIRRAAANRAGPVSVPEVATPTPTAAAPRSIPLRALGRGAGAVQLGSAVADMVSGGEVTAPQAVNAGLGAVTMAEPRVGLPLTVGYAAGTGLMDAAINRFKNVPYSIGDIRGPNAVAYEEGQKKAGQPVAVPAGAPSAAAPAPAAAPAALPASVSAPINPVTGGAPAAPPAISAPVQTRQGPLPTLQANPGESIFTSMLNLGKANAAYRDTQVANKQTQTDFNNVLKAGNFNLDAISKVAQVQTQFDASARANFDTELKTRSAEALRLLASGKYEKGQEQGLRLLAGLEKGKYHPAVIYGAPDENGVQQKMTVAVREDGTVVPLQIPNFQTPNQGKSLPAGMVRQVGTSGGKPVYEDAQGKQHVAK